MGCLFGVDVACSHCDATLTVYQSEADGQKDHVCDRACHRAWLSTTRRDAEKWSGDANPNWRGGVEQPHEYVYGDGWASGRRRAPARDDHTCQRCGSSRGELGQNPDVHHIRPARTFDAPVARTNSTISSVSSGTATSPLNVTTHPRESRASDPHV